MPEPKLSPIRRRMYKMFLDGKRHSVEEVLACMEDSQASTSAMRKHLSFLRDELQEAGVNQVIATIQTSFGTYYQLCVPLSSEARGYR